ncbi:NADH-ubiquinone oxidoreductase [Chaetomium sp. MPI-SDFR-AT-0129]|nr:NADH-ubiquinone oxidoreductase [Chaetomium sp. MPI-SDFR-AT-0129]
MASKTAAALAATTGGNAIAISKKYTVQSVGIWERLRRATALDPNRSNGVPLNPYNRYPAPGSNDPKLIDDPVTIPAGDIADNPYWKRDARRNYPRHSVVGQAQQVALLTVGSAAQPRVELVGEEGSKALVAAEEAGKETGVAGYLESSGVEAAKRVLELTGGLPPLPSGQSLASGSWDVHKYGLETEQSYTEE